MDILSVERECDYNLEAGARSQFAPPEKTRELKIHNDVQLVDGQFIAMLDVQEILGVDYTTSGEHEYVIHRIISQSGSDLKVYDVISLEL